MHSFLNLSMNISSISMPKRCKVSKFQKNKTLKIFLFDTRRFSKIWHFRCHSVFIGSNKNYFLHILFAGCFFTGLDPFYGKIGPCYGTTGHTGIWEIFTGQNYGKIPKKFSRKQPPPPLPLTDYSLEIAKRLDEEFWVLFIKS